jgi:transketolase
MPMGMADVATTLFKYHLRFNPKNPNWINRDRFILSAGHGSMLLYSLLYLTGYESISIENIKKFRQLDSICAGHPEYKKGTGIEDKFNKEIEELSQETENLVSEIDKWQM